MSEYGEPSEFNPEAPCLQTDTDDNQAIPVIINDKTTKFGRVVHQPKFYKDFYLDDDLEYGQSNKRVKYPICNQVSYHRINERQKKNFNKISSHTEPSSYS